jgi:hypothetical protein
MKAPWQVWVKSDGSLSYPREVTFEDLVNLADELIEAAARAKKIRQNG